MNTEERLNQLEPLVAEALAVLDRHTAQLKQLNNAVAQNTQVLIQQSDNISFLLREHIVIKTDVATLKTDVATLKTDVAEIKADVAEMKTEFGNKLDLILAKLK